MRQHAIRNHQIPGALQGALQPDASIGRMLRLVALLFEPTAHEMGCFDIVFDYEDAHGRVVTSG